jgi:hypothetical protein
MTLFSRLRAKAAAKVSPFEVHEVAKLLVSLAWFEQQDGELKFYTDGCVAKVFETRDKTRVRVAESHAHKSINEAIEEVQGTIRAQEQS